MGFVIFTMLAGAVLIGLGVLNREEFPITSGRAMGIGIGLCIMAGLTIVLGFLI